MKKWIAAACAVGVTFVAVGSAGASATGVGTTTPAGTVRGWATQYMDGGGQVSEAKALADAANFDAISAHENAYRPWVGEMRAANPNLQLFVYMNGTFTYRGDLPEAVYSHDASGRRIRAKGWSWTYLLNPASAAAVAYDQQRAKDLVAYSGYDGLFLDVLGPAPLDANYVTSLPVNPATRQVWTKTAWLATTTSLANQVRSSLGAPVVGNGLVMGASYFNADTPTSQLLSSGMEGGMPEAWMRSAWQGGDTWRSEAAWKNDVDMLADAGNRGESVLTITKVWSYATQAQKDQWYSFALASFLLGNDGHSYFGFSGTAPGGTTVDHAQSHISLGDPLAGYTYTGGVYQRDFTAGKVLVNPTKTAVTVTLGGVYFDEHGQVVTSLTVLPHTGRILHI
jgi:hypothetical protein